MEQKPSAAPAGTVTFLFSDMEGSTRLLQALGEDYRTVVSRHHAILRTAVAEAGGRIVDTSGDGAFAAFTRARDAVMAAVALQREVAGAEWPRDARPSLRIGLHTGEPSLSAEGYVGLDVHRAARICSAGSGGQVLLSATTRGLVEGDLPAGVSLTDLGSHRLKDLREPERLFQLVIEGLRSDFPPPRSLQALRLGFPAATTRLIGRDADVEAVARLARSPGVRLVTLTGPGGTGKTRLALAAADALADALEHGACFVSLAAISDPELVPVTILHALGLRESPSRSAADVVVGHLRGMELLLVLDNFEQVGDAAPVVARLLAGCSRLRVLVTSRVVLRLSGEHEVPVAPLELPDTSRDDSAAALEANPAVALFVERARAVRPDFQMNDETAPAVAELCVRLDGLPLALELAAARIRVFSPHALLARLGNRLDLLTGGARDLPERHQTLRAAIAWSYELLDAGERALFRRLAVFAGGVTLEAAERVSAASGPAGLDVFDGVSSLLEQSLLRQDRDVHGEQRFEMLDTVRAFGLECAGVMGELDAIRRAHARHFLAFAEEAAPHLTGPEQSRWLDRLEADQDNLREALDLLEREDAQAALMLSAALYRLWIVRGQHRTGRERLGRILALPDARSATAARAHALHALGTLVHELSEYAVARPLLEESLAIFRELGDEWGVATASAGVGWVALMEGDLEAGRVVSEEARALHARLGSRRGEALCHNNLAMGDFFGGRLEDCRRGYDRALAIMEELGDRRGRAYMSLNVSWADRLQGRWEECESRVDDALGALALLRDDQLTGWGLLHRGLLALELGDADRAVAVLEESLGRWQQVGNRYGIALTLGSLALASMDSGDLERADALAARAVAEWEVTGSLHGRAFGLAARGEVLTAAHGPGRAGPVLGEAVRIAAGVGPGPPLLHALTAAATAASTVEPDAAARLDGAARALTRRMGAVSSPRASSILADLDARLRESLGDAALEQARADGASADAPALAELAARTLRADAATFPG